MNRSTLLIVLCALLTSCAKKKNTYPENNMVLADTFYYLRNYKPYALYVGIYTNSTNRDKMTNAVYSCTVPAGGLEKIPWSAADPTTPYLYDIYSDDYRYSIWGNDNYGITFISRGNPLLLDLNTQSQTNARYYLLHGNNEQTSWRGIDTSLRLHMLINRNKTIIISYYQSAYRTYVNDTGTIKSAGQYEKYCSVNISDFNEGFTAYIYSTPKAPKTLDPQVHSSIDTITFSYLNREWILVRE